jgi:hypothetical protein
MLAAACGRQGDPPGGPPDVKPPVVLGVYPESGAVSPTIHGDAVIQYDEVIDEMGGGGSSAGTTRGGGAAGGLASHVLLSPTAGPYKVSWHRSSIHVKPEEGWKPGRIYHLEILPGIADLRHNVTKQRRTIIFSTGPPVPHAALSGIALQWAEQKTLVGGLVRAQLLPDTIAYLGVTDSTGGFLFEDIPPGKYVVYAVADQNSNRVRDRREAYDSLPVAVDSSASVLLWTFLHDSIGPRLRQADPVDSTTVRVTFSAPIDPFQPLDSLTLRVLTLPDSAPVKVAHLYSNAAYDSLAARERAAADSVRAATDTTKPAPPKPDTTRDTTARGRRPAGGPAPDTSTAHLLLRQRPAPQDKLILRFDTLLTPSARYFIEIGGARNLNGAVATSHTVLAVPKPKPPPAPAPRDTTKAKPDTTRVKRDSTRP